MRRARARCTPDWWRLLFVEQSGGPTPTTTTIILISVFSCGELHWCCNSDICHRDGRDGCPSTTNCQWSTNRYVNDNNNNNNNRDNKSCSNNSNNNSNNNRRGRRRNNSSSNNSRWGESDGDTDCAATVGRAWSSRQQVCGW